MRRELRTKLCGAASAQQKPPDVAQAEATGFSAVQRAYVHRIGLAAPVRSHRTPGTFGYPFHTFPALPYGPCGSRNATFTCRKWTTYTVISTMHGRTRERLRFG